MGEAPDAVSAELICLPILLPNLLFRYVRCFPKLLCTSLESVRQRPRSAFCHSVLIQSIRSLGDVLLITEPSFCPVAVNDFQRRARGECAPGPSSLEKNSHF
jgi:hypothetical protein